MFLGCFIAFLRPSKIWSASQQVGGTGLFRRQEREVEVFGGGGATARGFLERSVAVGRVLGLFAVEDFLNGQDLP